MDHLQTRLDALEQRTHTVERQLRWWRGLAGGLIVLGLLSWALPLSTAQEDTGVEGEKDKKGLEQRVAALETLLKHFSRKGDEVFITGANLHLVNGLGQTACGSEEEPIPDCPNGLGNLIVGYNELRGGTEDERTGSHNMVIGQRHSFSRFGGLVVGDSNTIGGDFAVVSGGVGNTASGENSSVSGGQGNTASRDNASVSGGVGNTASGVSSSVSGGAGNTASGDFAVVSGGGGFEDDGNTASGFISSVSGGVSNTASGDFSWVSGGQFNTATSFSSSVSGGQGNTASGLSSSVSGGQGNTASGFFATVSGGQNITQDTESGWSAGSEADEVVVGNFRSP